MLHSLLGASLCVGQMEKKAVDNNDSSHEGTNISSSCFEIGTPEKSQKIKMVFTASIANNVSERERGFELKKLKE